MLSGTGKKHERNPIENASWLSIITFSFAGKIFKKAFRREFQQEDVYEIPHGLESSKVGDMLEKEWDHEKKYGKGWILRSLVKIVWKQFLLLELSLIIFETPSMVFAPILMGKVTSYFTQGQTEVTIQDAYLYTTGLVAILIFYNCFNNLYLLYISEMSLKVRIACSSLLYRKCLKLTESSMSKYSDGRLVTLLTKDVMQFESAFDMALVVVNGLLQTMVMTYVSYVELGAAAFCGLGFMLLIFPVHVYLGYQTSIYRLKTAKRTDQRVKLTQEVLTTMRIIKTYTWESFFSKSIETLRKKELRSLRILLYLKALVTSIGALSSRIAFYICVTAYIAFGNHITAEKAFIVTGYFAVLQGVLTSLVPSGIITMAEVIASTKRISEYLELDEVPVSSNVDYGEEKRPGIFISNAIVKSDKGVNVLDNINLEINKGFTVLTGPVGSGKTVLLKLMLTDLKRSGGRVDVTGRMSYASQESWLFPGTIKQNILFGEKIDDERYETVVRVCALRKDLDDFPQGDRTCLTDKGLNLSGGQKARINLARAVYKKADIYLIDNCLSAVDIHVANLILNKCVKGFLKDKICVVVTHRNRFIRQADDVIGIENGKIQFQGSYNDLKKNEGIGLTLKGYYEKDEESYVREDEFQDVNAAVVNQIGKLLDVKDSIMEGIYHEAKEEGSIKKKVYTSYITSGGIKMLILVVILSIAAHAASSWADYFVSFWVDNEQELSGFRYNHTTDSSEYKRVKEDHESTMKQYSFVIFAAIIFTLMKSFSFFSYTLIASRNIHNLILKKILKAGMIFFDTHLSGNVLNRFSRDLGILDEKMPYTVHEVITKILMLIATLLVVSSVNLFFLIPSSVLLIILILARNLYIPAGRSLRRLEGSTRSPVIGYLNATLEGLTTIRANQAQTILKKEFDRHQDHYNSVCYMNLATTRGFAFYLGMLGSVYIAVVTISFLLVKTESLAGQVGLAITKAFSLVGLLESAVRAWTEFENHMTSTERVLEYSKIESEQKAGDELKHWPNNGKVVYTDVNLQYSSMGEKILKDVNFEVFPRQKISVVGRTGAGKSSIISTLLKLYQFNGSICIDDVDINNVDVKLLRSRVSVIPQDPVLFSGTLRSNLDPNNEYSDNALWDALDEVEMKKLINSLDCIIGEDNVRFSIGQKQLLCLARAVLRNNVILILDEATANIDPKTDSLIQRIIKRKFEDSTIITITHKLHTIMDSDNVLVMDSGVAVEFGHPKQLLERKGFFYEMVREAGLLPCCID